METEKITREVQECPACEKLFSEQFDNYVEQYNYLDDCHNMDIEYLHEWLVGMGLDYGPLHRCEAKNLESSYYDYSIRLTIYRSTPTLEEGIAFHAEHLMEFASLAYNSIEVSVDSSGHARGYLTDHRNPADFEPDELRGEFPNPCGWGLIKNTPDYEVLAYCTEEVMEVFADELAELVADKLEDMQRIKEAEIEWQGSDDSYNNWLEWASPKKCDDCEAADQYVRDYKVMASFIAGGHNG